MTTTTTGRSNALLTTTALVPALIAMTTPAAAQNWDGGAGTVNWTDAANWDPDGVPIDNRAVTFDNSDQVTLNAASANLNTVTVNDRAFVNINALLTARRVSINDEVRFVIGFNGAVVSDFEVRGEDVVLANNGSITGSVLFSPVGFLGDDPRFFNRGPVTGSTTINGGTVELEFRSDFSDTQAFVVNGGIVNVSAADIVGPLSGTGGIINFLPRGRLTTSVSAGSSTFAGRMTGTSQAGGISFEKAGAGTLILTGNSDHAGGTLISGGTLQIGNGGTSGSLGSGYVVNDGALVFNRSNDVASAGVISGTGSLTKLGTGTLTVSGENTYAGDTFVNEGAIAYLGSNPFGTGTVRLANGTILRGVNPGSTAIRNAIAITGSATFDNPTGTGPDVFGTISGGQLVKTGGGRALLYAANTYTGGTLLREGTLTVVNSQAFGTGAVTMADSTRIQAFSPFMIANPFTFESGQAQFETVLDIAALTLTGKLSGAGGLHKTGSGTLTLSGVNIYAGLTTVSGGTLAITNNRALGSSDTGTIVGNGATLAMAAPSSLISSEAITISGSGFNNRGALRFEAGTSILEAPVTLAGNRPRSDA